MQVFLLAVVLLAQEAIEWRAFLHPDGPFRLLLAAFSAAAVAPTPATHAILTVLKAGETVYLLQRVYQTLLLETT